MANSAQSLLLSCLLLSDPTPNSSFGFKRSLNGNQRLGIKGKCSIREPLLSKRLNLVCVRAGEKDLVGSSTAEEIVTELDKPSIESDLEERKPSVATILANFTNDFDPYYATSTPLYQTATFKQHSTTEFGSYDYTESGNPTRDMLQSLLAKLEKADSAFCFTSGMAALAIVTYLLESGQEIVAGDDLYGGSDRLLSQVVSKRGIAVTRVKTSDFSDVASAIGPRTKLVWLESPTYPCLQIVDIRKVSEIAHSHGALVLVDNSILSPILCQPLELGADIAMISSTKFISGYSDIMGGTLAVKEKGLAERIAFLQNAVGSGLAPSDCGLCLRDITTMGLRVEKQQASAQKIAEFLSSHPRVTKVSYPGLPNHPGHELHFSQATGAGFVLSFFTGLYALSKHIAEKTKYFSMTVNSGSVNSHISLPYFTCHISVPAKMLEAQGLTKDLVRMSVGIEDVDDLIAALDDSITNGPQLYLNNNISLFIC